MKEFTRPRVGAWAILMLLTAISWWLGAGHGAHGGGIRITAMTVLLIAFIKVAIVAAEFMEVRFAGSPLRLIVGGWIVCTWGLLTSLCLLQ